MVYADQFSSVMPSWWSGVANIFSGVPWPVWASIAWAESSFNPASWNMGTAAHPEDSGGLFALNRAGGQGAGYSREWLKDPLNNATIAAPSIKAAYRQYGDDIGAVAIASGHPGSTATRDNALVQRITSTYAWMTSLADPIEAVKKLLSGYTIPIIGGGSGNIGSGIASGLLQGIFGPIGSWWASFAAGGPDKWIDTLAPGLFIFTGTNLIGAGLLVGALKSPVAQTAADAAMAAGPAPVKIAGGVVKAAGGNTSPLFTQVRQRNERRERAKAARAAQGSPRPARKRVRSPQAVKRPGRTS